MAKISLENQPSKSKLDLSNVGKDDSLTWDGSDPATWDDADSNWEAPKITLTKVSKGTKITLDTSGTTK